MQQTSPLNSSKAAFVDDDQEAQINSDMLLTVIENTLQMPWGNSPMANVKRKRLELIGTDAPRLTTLVKFAEASHFKAHEHDGGEEFLVLDGVFSDAFKDFPRGSYVRNPPGTSHQPYSKSGCIILVKLRQFQEHDQQQFAVNIFSPTANQPWQETSSAGVQIMDLHEYKGEKVGMYRFQEHPSEYEIYVPRLGELFIFSGQVEINHVPYSEGYWMRYPSASQIKLKSRGEAMIWFKNH